ncbi:MAG: thioredoxin family protein [Bacteroidetes bacterium]|nr:thioredoxin family protein [Bacteroidota bacterium]
MKRSKNIFLFPLFYSLIYFSPFFWSGAGAEAFSQIQKPVKWHFSVNKISDTEVELILKATIDKNWHIYAMNQESDQGPISLTFNFEKNKNYSLDGKINEPAPEKMFDKNFEMNVKYFEREAAYKQKVKILSQESFVIKGTLNFMTCNDNMCLPPTDVDFEFKIEGKGAVSPNTIAVIKKDSNTLAKTNSVDTAQKVSAANIDDENFNDNCGSLAGDDFETLSGWSIFIQGLIGGLLALLTPCVFSMIPLTVSFFIKQSKDRKKGFRNALVYSISIVLIYVALGFIITKLFGADTLNKMASDVWFNLFFFVIFIVFAVSFFGVFEITLPSSWANRTDRAAERGGLIGIFFMAFTLSLVSFSCTGPIIGTLLVQAAVGGGTMGPLLGMTGFAIALALPFALFAAFPAWLSSLPKAGGWLNTVKVSLGFLELALALKFLSNVDLAYHWGILKREIFISLWIIIFGLWGFYLLGKIRFSHDSEAKRISITRLMFAIVVLSFTLYLIPGLWGAPLKLISGFPPPDFYKVWNTEKTEDKHCPHDLSCFHDYDEGMAYAKSQGKPVMLDFTGWSCVNCRKMEDNVWGDPEVLKRLQEDYVLISLYVDDKTSLPEKEQNISKTTGNKIKNLGNKWSDLQAAVYKTNSQPYYVLIDNNAKKLAKPRGGYNPDVNIFKQFLDEGLCRYKKRKE